MILRITTLTVLLLPICLAHFDASGCGSTKKCIFVPEGCEQSEDLKSCQHIFAYYTESDDGWTDMELYNGQQDPKKNYMAVAFSKDDVMGNDHVTQCVFSDKPEPEAHLSFNFGKTNSGPSEANDVNVEQDHLKLVHGHRDENGMYCHIKQKSSSTVNQFLPDLKEDSIILLASGSARSSRVLGIHSLDSSSPDFPFINSEAVRVGEVSKRAAEPVQGGTNTSSDASTTTIEEPFMSKSTRFFIIRLHGILMTISWMFFVALAVLSARYLKDHFSNSSPGGLKWWFHIHRTANLLAVLLILIATFLIFLAKDWTWTGPRADMPSDQNTGPGSIHSLAGIIAVIISVLQPLMALLRCAPDTGARPIFNWSHRIVGLLGFICAMIALLIASNAFVSLWGDHIWSFTLVIFYILILLAAVIVFEVLTYMKKDNTKTFDVEMRKRSSRYDDRGRVVNHTTIIHKKPMMGITALYVVFGLFAFCIVAALTILLVI